MQLFPLRRLLAATITALRVPGRLSRLERAASLATLLVPVFMVHGRVIGEALMIAVAVALLLRSAALGEFAWLRRPWMVIGLLWWGWLVLCSLPRPDFGGGGLGGIEHGGIGASVQALLVIRFLLFVAALETFALRESWARRALSGILSLAALYIAVQSVWQFATGTNFFGEPRGGDGELTGPYDKPRAGGQFSLLLYPVLLPPVAALLGRAGYLARFAGAALGLLGIAVMVLIGQRMPLILALFGLVMSGLLLPRLRFWVVIALMAAVTLIGASRVVSPPTYYRLVTKFSDQMEHFPESPYGVIYARARAMIAENPLTGLGFDGFRHYCGEARYFHGWRWPADPTDDGGGLGGCQMHPHNLYLEAATNAGLPGLALFTGLALAWLGSLGRGLWRAPEPRRAGLFVAVLVYFWPIASTSSFTAMPLSGFFFVLLGFGLALAREARKNPGEMSPGLSHV